MKTTKRVRKVKPAAGNGLQCDAQIARLLRSVETLDVTAEELAAFDDSSFTMAQPDEGPSVANPTEILVVLDDLMAAETRREPKVEIMQGALFNGKSTVDTAGETKYHFEVSRQRFTSLVPLVVEAFADSRQGWSPDYVIVDPARNLDFLKRCWQLGAAATPEELNWTLMNARKDGRLAKLPAANRYSIAKKELDSFGFAAEMALRELQDRAWHEEQRADLSLDKLLCSPRLAERFDKLARSIAPGYSSLQYRWAAMSLRKARRLAKQLMPMPLFEECGFLGDVRPSRLSEYAGVFWVSFPDRSAYVGVAENLKLQIDAFIESLGAGATPEWLQDRPQGRAMLRYAAMEKAKIDDRERMRSSIFRRHGSRLNFTDASLFSERSRVA
jgi:hypothetical protein